MNPRFLIPSIFRTKSLVGVTLAIGLLSGAPLWGAGESPEALMQQAAAQERAGQFRDAAASYGRAGEAFAAAGQSERQAAAMEQSAAMYEKWADQLAVPTAPAASKVAQTAPGSTKTNTSSTKPPTVALPRATVPPPISVTARPGYIVGRAVTAAGAPLPKFKVYYSGFEKGKFYIQDAHVGAVSNISSVIEGANGRFAAKVPDGLYDSNAWLELTYHGKAYKLPLAPEPRTYDYPNQKLQYLKGGLVHNYVWRISGLRGVAEGTPVAGNWYGGLIHVDCQTAVAGQGLLWVEPAGSQIEITLVPQEPLIDGSTGTTIVRQFPLHLGDFVKDVPVGCYTATARLIRPDGSTHALKLSSEPSKYDGQHARIPWQEAVTVIFPPSNIEYSAVNPMGIGQAEIFLGEPDAASISR